MTLSHVDLPHIRTAQTTTMVDLVVEKKLEAMFED